MCANRDQCENSNCKYAHKESELRRTNDRYKTSLCIQFSKGQCKDAENCRYAHGEGELRNKVPSIQPPQIV